MASSCPGPEVEVQVGNVVRRVVWMDEMPDGE